MLLNQLCHVTLDLLLENRLFCLKPKQCVKLIKYKPFFFDIPSWLASFTTRDGCTVLFFFDKNETLSTKFVAYLHIYMQF